MNLTWDDKKQQDALHERGLHFSDASVVFAAMTFEFEDLHKDYGERRMVCYGLLQGRLVVVGYVQRGQMRHIFSMRKANEREQTRFGQ